MNIHLSEVSSNVKTGPIPVTTSSAKTCPDACALKKKNLCYAAFGPLAMHWRRVTTGFYAGLTWAEFLAKVRSFHNGQLWRHNQAGDLAGKNNEIDAIKLAELTQANKNKRGWTYTHKPVLGHKKNAQAVKLANKGGFTVNLSVDTLEQADKLLALKIGPVVSIVESNQTKNCKTPNGARVVICPASIRDNTTCANCGLCQWAKRDYVIAFPAHGVRKTTLNKLIAA